MPESPSLTQRRILALWWPLAASWLLMGIELPLFTACVARMPEPEVNLAAYGSLVFPIALMTVNAAGLDSSTALEGFPTDSIKIGYKGYFDKP